MNINVLGTLYLCLFIYLFIFMYLCIYLFIFEKEFLLLRWDADKVRDRFSERIGLKIG